MGRGGIAGNALQMKDWSVERGTATYVPTPPHQNAKILGRSMTTTGKLKYCIEETKQGFVILGRKGRIIRK